MIANPQLEGEIRLGKFDQVDINLKIIQKFQKPYEGLQKSLGIFGNFWEFLGYHKIDIWALVGPKGVENANRRNYLMNNSQKILKNLNSSIEA